MFSVNVQLAGELPALIAEHASRLTRHGSQMRGVFDRIAAGTPTDEDADIVVSYAAADGEDGIIGWASVGWWHYEGRSRREIQVFVSEEHRRQGVGFSLVAAVAHGMPISSVPVSVFSPEVLRIAVRLNLTAERFENVEGRWHRAECTDGRNRAAWTDEK